MARFRARAGAWKSGAHAIAEKGSGWCEGFEGFEGFEAAEVTEGAGLNPAQGSGWRRPPAFALTLALALAWVMTLGCALWLTL